VFSSESAIHPPVLEYSETTFKHFKPIARVRSNPSALDNSKIKLDGAGIYNLANTSIESFIEGIAQGRFWNR
ncbi:catalase HPII, partial [Bacillus anthracis]|nr:catalase HPII [Bacillus anthracis]